MDNNIVNPHRIVILMVCGVPGVGKTYLSNKLINQFKTKENIKSFYFNFDEIFVKDSFNDQNNKFDLLKFKASRIKLFEKFKLKMNDLFENSKDTSILIIDDNFYFKSMRKPYFKFAKINS